MRISSLCLLCYCVYPYHSYLNSAYKKFSSLQHDVSGPSTKTSTLCVPITTVANGINSLKVCRYHDNPVGWSTTELITLQVNPFNLQICSVFCTSENGKMSFVDFLDLVSVFSYKVRPSVQGRSAHVPHSSPISSSVPKLSKCTGHSKYMVCCCAI